ncbi:phage tail protein [Rhizobium sp. P44RR-XXIV]|uniref:phage tail protein n=1 Tax=Rhizobium sp. P44RR-XXIV TaxID=1921145 RepID=UPI0009CF9A73|nr:phage tail protein [Rhizobium sp. P44RR-XXIV]
MAEVGGIFKMLVGSPGGAVYSFTDDDIVVTEEQDFQPFPSLSATYNAIEATYPEPAEKWATKDAPGRYNADLEGQDGNRRLPAEIQLLAVPFANQVQRVGLAMIQDYRRFRVHQISLPPDAYPLEPNDVVSWSSARNGYDEKKFLVVKVEPQPSFLIVVTLKEVDPADYDWHPGLQLPTAIGWLGPITPPSQPMIGWTVEPSTIKDAGGIDRRPAIRISCAPDLDDVRGVWVQVRVKASGDVVFDSDSNPYALPYSWQLSGQWTLPNVEYEARGRYIPQSNRATDWSAWLTVKTPNVLIQAADVLDGAIVQSKIADAAVSAAKIMDEAVDNLKLANQAVSTAKLQVAAVTADVLASGAVISAKLADGAVTAAKLGQGAVDATNLASSIKAVEVVATLPTTDNLEGRQVFLTTDGKLYRYHNGAWTAAVAAVDVNGTLTGSQIADNAITGNKLAALAVDVSKIADGSVSATKLAANAVDATKFASGIRPVEIVASLPTSGNIEGRTVYLTTDDKLYRYTGTVWTAATAAGDIAGQIVGTQISDGVISTPKLAAGAITANTIAAGAITTDKIAANSITAGQIAAGAIGANQIAANSISAKQLVLTDFSNIADNGWQQGNLSGWQVYGQLAYANSNGEGAASGYYMRSGNGGWQALSSLVACSPGDVYYLEAWAQNNDLSSQVSIWLAGFDVNNVNIANTYVATTATTNAWAKISGQAIVPAGVTKCALLLYNTRASGSNVPIEKSVAWSKPVMRRASGAELIVDGAISASKVAANAISAVNIAANAITADKLVIADMTNRVENPNFAFGATSWGLTVGLSVITDASNAYAGSNYLNIAAPAIFTFNRNANIFPVIPGEQYFLQTFAKRTGAPSDSVSCRMRFMGSDKITFLTAIGVTVPTTTPTTYTEYNTSITVPAGVVWAWVDLVPTSTLTGAGSYQIGFVSCQRKSGGNLIVDGAVTADKIAANAITVGTISAGAVSAAQIATGAITADKLAAGSVSTQALAIGNGGNYLSNSDLSAGLTGWGPEWSNSASRFTLSLRADTYAPVPGAIEIRQNNGDQGFEYGVTSYKADGTGQQFAVRPNGWYELSVYYLGHRCNGVQPYLGVYDANGGLLAYPSWGVFPAAQNIDPQKSLANYQRFWGKYQMPANAARAIVFFRMKGTVAGQNDSLLWLTRMYFGEANPNQTEPSPWSDGGVTMIAGGNIVANAVTADKIAANAVTAGKIAVNAVIAGTIAAGAVTATTIAGGTITGDKLAANTIGAGQIAANAITAKQLVLTDFSNMADNGWQTGTLDGWATQNTQSFYLDTASGDAAGYVLQSLGRDCARSNFVVVTSSEIYAFDVWVYNIDPNPASIYAAVQTPSGAWGFNVVAGTNVKNGWTRLQGRYSVPSGFTKLAMLLQVDKTAGTGNACFWSKPVMRRAVSAELIVDGSVTANKIAVNSLDAITANLGSVNISSAVIGTLQVGTSNIQAGACTDTGVGRVAGVQNVSSNGNPFNLVSCGVTVAGDGRVVVDCMAIAQINKSGGAQNSQAVGLNIFRNGLAIFSQVYYLPVVRTVVSGGGNGGTSSETYTAGWVGISGFYDAPGAGWHVYTMQINNPGNTIGWAESNIAASSYKR